ncbi:MAG: ABC transporter permease [Clostridia bacterium]|nr:ABC transporter permease [Clostridia bacterium]
MNKTLAFCSRTVKEIIRDPLSYIFCLGFPIVMLLLMTVVNESIPEEAAMTVFEINNLGPAIAYFGLTFVLLFTSIQVSKDRSTALITRVYVSPMKSSQIIAGYTLPMLLIALCQAAIALTASYVVSLAGDKAFDIINMAVCLASLLPSMLLLVSVGLIFGTIVNEKAAPGIGSIIISVSGMLGGIWMDVEALGGALEKTAKILPFFHGIKAARCALGGQWDDMISPLAVTAVWAVAMYILAVLVMKGRLRKDVA